MTKCVSCAACGEWTWCPTVWYSWMSGKPWAWLFQIHGSGPKTTGASLTDGPSSSARSSCEAWFLKTSSPTICHPSEDDESTVAASATATGIGCGWRRSSAWHIRSAIGNNGMAMMRNRKLGEVKQHNIQIKKWNLVGWNDEFCLSTDNAWDWEVQWSLYLHDFQFLCSQWVRFDDENLMTEDVPATH